ncbi:hypothetical protein BU14_2582s0001, partial [Porphyra umbilicalis]
MPPWPSPVRWAATGVSSACMLRTDSRTAAPVPAPPFPPQACAGWRKTPTQKRQRAASAAPPPDRRAAAARPKSWDSSPPRTDRPRPAPSAASPPRATACRGRGCQPSTRGGRDRRPPPPTPRPPPPPSRRMRRGAGGGGAAPPALAARRSTRTSASATRPTTPIGVGQWG